MTNFEKVLILQGISVIALLITVYGGGAALLIAGILFLPWLLAKIVCGLALVSLVTRVIAAYYVMR